MIVASFALAVISLVVSIAAVVVSLRSVEQTKRQADEARRQADAALELAAIERARDEQRAASLLTADLTLTGARRRNGPKAGQVLVTNSGHGRAREVVLEITGGAGSPRLTRGTKTGNGPIPDVPARANGAFLVLWTHVVDDHEPVEFRVSWTDDSGRQEREQSVQFLLPR